MIIFLKRIWKLAARRTSKHVNVKFRNLSRLLLQNILFGFLLSVIVYPVDAFATDVWLAGVDPYVRQAMKPGDPSDYIDLFRPTAPWSHTAQQIRVFKTSTQYLANEPEEELRQMFADLKLRGVALGAEGLMIPRSGQCGRGVEGYSAPGTMRALAERTKRLGGELRYIAMDEPLWFGHRFGGSGACHSNILDVAHGVAENVSAVQAVFPEIQIGDIEPIMAEAGANWTDEILQWADAYKAVTGKPLAFVHADLAWMDDVAGELPALAAGLRARNVMFGIIYDGEPTDSTDRAWTDHAEQRFDQVESDGKLIPDNAILQTWMLHPAHMLPESESGTMTNLVLRYSRTRTKIEASAVGDLLKGRLTDSKGVAVANAEVVLFVRQNGKTGALTMHGLSGAVPARAVQAIVGLRLNTECSCKGNGDAGFGPIQYKEGAGVTMVHLPSLPSTSTQKPADPDILEFHTATSQSVNINSNPFNVTAGELFDFAVPLRASIETQHSGYLALIFLDKTGKEIERDKLQLIAGEKETGKTRTDSDGRFVLQISGKENIAEVSAVYAGDGNNRKATWGQ